MQRPMSDLEKIIVSAVIASITGGGVGYFTALEAATVQVNRLEERQHNNFAEMMRRLDELKGDVQGIRSEIMGIIKERP